MMQIAIKGTSTNAAMKAVPLQIAQLVGVILIGLLFVSLWDVKLLRVQGLGIKDIRWFQFLALGMYVFLFHGLGFNFYAARKLLIIYGLMIVGALLSVLRADDVSQVSNNTAGMAAAQISFLLMLPVLATRRLRMMSMLALIGVAVILSVQVLVLTAQFGGRTRFVFKEYIGDKNYVTLCLSLASTALLSFALFWRISSARRLRRVIIRILATIGCFCFIYVASLTYSRSGLLTAISAAVIVLSLYAIKKKVRGWIVSIFLVSTLAILTANFLPEYLEAYPFWKTNFGRFVNWQSDDEMRTRRTLFAKGIELVSENPIIGIGPGLSQFARTEEGQSGTPKYLIHNSYLTTWVELGMLGLVGCFFYLTYLSKELIAHLQRPNAELINLVWLMTLVPFFIMQFFLDVGTLSMFLIALLAGISYERDSARVQKRPVWRSVE